MGPCRRPRAAARRTRRGLRTGIFVGGVGPGRGLGPPGSVPVLRPGGAPASVRSRNSTRAPPRSVSPWTRRRRRAIAWTEAALRRPTAVRSSVTPGPPPAWTGPVAAVHHHRQRLLAPGGHDDLRRRGLSWLEAADLATGPYTLQTAWFLGGKSSPGSAPTPPGLRLRRHRPRLALGDEHLLPGLRRGPAGLVRRAPTAATYQVYTATFNAAPATWAAPVLERHGRQRLPADPGPGRRRGRPAGLGPGGRQGHPAPPPTSRRPSFPPEPCLGGPRPPWSRGPWASRPRTSP